MFESILKLFKKEENSKNVAKERLKLVLIHDKANVSPQFLEMVNLIQIIIHSCIHKNILYFIRNFNLYLLSKIINNKHIN